MILTVKQKLILESCKKLYKKYHTKTTLFTKEYCKNIVKITVDELYRICPDKNVGKLTVLCLDEKFKQVSSIDENTYCFEMDFHDIYTGVPWMIIRFYKGVSNYIVYTPIDK